jgi:hypothetical protein
MTPGRATLGRCFYRTFPVDWCAILCLGKLRGQLFEARFGRIEEADLLDRFTCVVQHADFDRV